MTRTTVSACLALVAAVGLFGQSGATRLTFEVASIKPTPPGAEGRWIRMQSTHDFAAKNHALKTLIAAAYNLHPGAIAGGPECKLPPPA